MSSGRQVSFFTFSRWSLCGLLCMLLVSSCFVVPRNYNPGKPFVYKTTINIEGKTPDYDRQELLTKLHDQMDDSLKARPVSYAGVYYDLNRPPVFDSLNIGRSKVFMSKGLNSMGYFQPVIEDTFFIDTVPNRRKGEQKRVYISFNVKPGTATHIDSINYVLETPELQALALKTRRESLLKKGQPYADQKVLGELDRLVGLYRDSGYYKITKENIYAERDTVVAALIDPTLDPFEQIRLLDSLKKKREKPTISVTIRQRAVKDSSHIQKYYIGNVTVYPDQSILEDSSYIPTDSITIQGYKFLYSTQRFKLPFIANNIRLRPGSLYSQRRYYRVINTFNQLGAWQNVDLSLQERKDSLPLLDAVLRLYPAMKYSLSVDYETSRNVSDFLSQGTFFGLGLNFRLLNRNAYREAIQTSTTARFGIEIGTHLVQTLQASVSHNIYFPKIIIPKVNLPEWIKDIFPRRVDGTERTIARRTVLNLAGTYTDRRDFFRAPSFNTSWGYEWTRRRSRSLDPDNAAQRWTKSYQLTPFNFEYTNLHKTDSLRKLEEDIPAYRFAFNDGMIISTIFSVTAGRQYDEDKRLTLIRGRIEESGALFGLFKNLELGDLRRFVKIDGEIKHYINYKKSSWAFRAFGGVAFIYGKTDTGGVVVKENNLPFFKAFFAGGPYSMRAWQVRRLGPGSSTLYDINDTTRVDRFGNMQLEFNAEYRFNLTTIAGIKINSALFVDIGNIWSKEYLNGVEVPEASFKLSRLYKDIAVGAGTSLRLDFEFFLIRLDWAYRLKNPRYATVSDGWFQKIDITSGQLQLGIGYPF